MQEASKIWNANVNKQYFRQHPFQNNNVNPIQISIRDNRLIFIDY